MTAPRRRRPGPEAWALLAVLALAAALRFTGLGFGLRHPPHSDERVFVESVEQMLAAGDLDHRYYEYPGLVFYLLLPVLRLAPGAAEGGPAAYLAARALIAAFGVAACALLYLWARALAGTRAGLMAALLLAVSPVAVETAHTLRPDVVLHAAAIVALLAFTRLGPSPRGDLWAGVALGVAGAVKFSAALIVPAYLVARLLAPGRAWRGVLLAGVVAVAVFLLFTPYAVLHPAAFLEGMRVQVGYHYDPDAHAPVSDSGMLLEYLRIAGEAVGLPAALLAVAGAALARREWRRWAPAAALLLASLLVLASSDVRHERFLLPALPVVFLLAAWGADRLLQTPLRFTLGALAVASVPLAASFRYARALAGPGTRDRIVDWVHAELAPGALVVSSVPLLGLDPARVEVLEVPRLRAENRAQILEADLVLATPWDDPEATSGLERAFQVDRALRVEGPVITAWRVPPALRPRYQRLALGSARLLSSRSPGELDLLRDGRLDTLWRTDDA
ncbi:MAG TPA: glycosyltransferase family 39 protein, partial [Vicinamibacteria bacterium]